MRYHLKFLEKKNSFEKLARSPQDLKRWLEKQSGRYIYSRAYSDTLMVKNTNKMFNRLVLEIYTTCYSLSEIKRMQLRGGKLTALEQGPSLVITDFKLSKAKNEVELQHPEDIFKDIYLLSKKSTLFQNELQNTNSLTVRTKNPQILKL